MTRYWVVGGEYADTSFTRIAGGGAEERIGPFATYDDAKAAWQERAWQTVDSAHHRYRIEEESGATETHYWVVGGAYTDTHFNEPAEGVEHWYGPFDSYDDARAEWQRHAWGSVDDALSRYRIEKRSGARPAEAR
jgi:hypothetical protein